MCAGRSLFVALFFSYVTFGAPDRNWQLDATSRTTPLVRRAETTSFTPTSSQTKNASCVVDFISSSPTLICNSPTSATSRRLCAQTSCEVCTKTEAPVQPVPTCTDCSISGSFAVRPDQNTVPQSNRGPANITQETGNSSKRKRTLPVPDDYEGDDADEKFNNFLEGEIYDDDTLLVPSRGEETGGSESALAERFSTSSQTSMAVTGLYGCSSVVLISRKAVYMSHLFEDPGFVKYDDSGNGIPANQMTPIAPRLAAGDSTIIDEDSDVDGRPWLPNLNGLSQQGGPFDPSQPGGVQAILITPSQYADLPGPYRYQMQVNSLLTWLRRYNSRPGVYTYNPADLEEVEKSDSPRGKVLFQFDPNAALVNQRVQVQGQTMVRQVQYAGFKLWIGEQDVSDGTLTPYFQQSWPVRYGPMSPVA